MAQMSTLSTKCLVAKLTLQSNTYYVTSRDGVTLDSIDYKNAVTSWGDGSLIGNFGTNFQIGSMSIQMTNGEFITDGGWEFDITDVWNNKTCEVKLCNVGTDTTFADCKPYYKGIIKDFSCDGGEISFSLDNYDNSDDILLPAVVCEDQTALSTAESQYNITDSGQIVGDYTITINVACTIFRVGDMVLLRNNSGDYEYNRIANIVSDVYTMVNPLLNVYETVDEELATIRKAFVHIPKDMVGKSLPIQGGDLSDVSNGIFGKTLYISEAIGEQSLLMDYLKLKLLTSIGMWESGSKRYFVGRERSVVAGVVQGEYEISSNFSSIIFRVDSATTLGADIDTVVDDFTEITVVERENIQWVDESTLPSWQTTPELLSVNIIQIGGEFMLVIEKPSGSGAGTIWVERGALNSTISKHSSGDKIYQCAKFSARNLLSFIEKFLPVSISNQWYEISALNEGGDFKKFLASPDTTSKWKNVSDNDAGNSNYLRFHSKSLVDSSNPYLNINFCNFDLKFSVIKDAFSAYRWDYLMKVAMGTAFTGSQHPGATIDGFNFAAFDPNGDTTRDEDIETSPHKFPSAVITTDNFDDQTFDNTNDHTIVGTGVFVAVNNFNDSSTDLLDLNKKWKFGLQIEYRDDGNDGPDTSTVEQSFYIYALGLWIYFFSDFTRNKTVANLTGRMYSTQMETFGVGGAGNLIENPVDFIIHLLMHELGKVEADFYKTHWLMVSDFYGLLSNWDTTAQPDFPVPEIAFSYGIDDERKKGFEFCSWIASHFNLSIYRDTAGQLEIVNLWKNQNNPGTPSEINIEDILQVPGGQRRISIKQTGVDLLYNDVIVNYKRNNSTGEYQAVYVVPDSLVLVNPIGGSPNTVAQAREYFYNGKKRTLTIDSPFIYNEYDAIRKAQWEMNDKAEAKFWVEFYVDYELYDNKGNSYQYKIGDVIALVGKCNGIVFDANRKFVIQDIVNCDSGRELCIHAKSNDPVTAFFF
jgi:hypothetical protein